MNKTKLVVYNEHTLGYIEPEHPDIVHTLSDSVIKGAPFRVFCAPNYVSSSDKVRLAGRKDFHDFRVCFEGYYNLELYDYDNSTL